MDALTLSSPAMMTELPASATTYRVQMPARWHAGSDKEYTYVFLDAEPAPESFSRIYSLALQPDYPNLRVFTPYAFQLTAVYHPLFYSAVNKQDAYPIPEDVILFNGQPQDKIDTTQPIFSELVNFWLQSFVFLSGVTLSAALIQNRWSAGTIESKLGRLWQAGCVAEKMNFKTINDLNLRETVKQLAFSSLYPKEQLLILKKQFAALVYTISQDMQVDKAHLKEISLTPERQKRFGFIPQLQKLLGNQLTCILAYGSSIDSQEFADYDLILIVRDTDAALGKLRGQQLSFKGKELNISVFDKQEFWHYQLLSGDNLTTHAICLYGEAEAPVKPVNTLLARNFSFGFIRMRQLLGMAAFAQSTQSHYPQDDKHNLYQYFIKIPLNVVRGIQGALGSPMSKEKVIAWCKQHIGFDIEFVNHLYRQGKTGEAIARAALATQHVLFEYDKTTIAHELNLKKTI